MNSHWLLMAKEQKGDCNLCKQTADPVGKRLFLKIGKVFFRTSCMNKTKPLKWDSRITGIPKERSVIFDSYTRCMLPSIRFNAPVIQHD